MKKRENRSSSAIFQWVSIFLLLLSSLPCALTYFNISPVIQYAIETKNNVSLQLFIPLTIASCLAGFGLILLVVSLLIQKKSDQELLIRE